MNYLSQNESSLKVLSDAIHKRSRAYQEKKFKKQKPQRSNINSETLEEETYNSYFRNEIETESGVHENQKFSIRRTKSIEKISRSKSWDHSQGGLFN